MTFGVVLLGFLGSVNPCRTRLALPERRDAVALGAALALLAGAALAAVGDPLLDALEISPESFRLAVGLVLALEGARTLVWPRPAAEPELQGLAAALVPIAFPLLLQPGVVVLAIAAGWRAVAAFAVALVLVLFVPRSPLLLAGARLLAAVELVAAAAIAVSALRDV